MANLEAMRTFQRHWTSYCAEERTLARLCTQLPLDISGLGARERRLPPFAFSTAAVYDRRALAGALGPDGAHLGYRVDEGIQWNWWLAYDAWRAVIDERSLLDERAACIAELAAVAADTQRALDGDEELARDRSTLRDYAAADAEERSELARMNEQRKKFVEPYEQDEARRAPWIAHPWRRLKLWFFKSFRMRDELDKIDQKIADIQAKLDVRERKIGELGDAVAARTALLEEPFAPQRKRSLEAILSTERELLSLLDHDLAARDETYEQGSVLAESFEDGLAHANEREWALLGRWMTEYGARLPEEIVHARNMVESELVWLEGYAPYGKRYWPLTDRVVAAMEEGRADTSDLALKLVQGSS